MQERDRPKFTELIQALGASFRVDPSPALFEGYWLGLQSLTIEAVAKAVGAAIGTLKRMPVPAELRELAGDVPAAVAGIQAWTRVRQAVASVGAYRSVDFGPVVNGTIRALGGWNHLCREELTDWVRKDFERIFTQLSTHGVPENQGMHLVGLHELENREAYKEFTGQVVRIGIEEAPEKQPRLKAMNGHTAEVVSRLADRKSEGGNAA